MYIKRKKGAKERRGERGRKIYGTFFFALFFFLAVYA